MAGVSGRRPIDLSASHLRATPSIRPLGPDMQKPAAMLAVDRIHIVDQESAIGTFVTDLARPEDRLEEPQEKADAYHHDDDGKEPSSGPD